MATESVQQEFEEANWDEISESNFDVVAISKRKEELLTGAGYIVDEKGILRDKDTNKKVIAEDGKEINLKIDRKLALVKGSHNFVRNIAGYSQILTNKGFLKILPIED